MPLTVSRMRERDIATIAALRMEAFFASTDRTHEEDCAGLRQLLAGEGSAEAFVACIDGNAVGSVSLCPRNWTPRMI